MKRYVKHISMMLLAAVFCTQILGSCPVIAKSKIDKKIPIEDTEKSIANKNNTKLIIKYKDEANSKKSRENVRTKLKLKKMELKKQYKKQKLEVIEIGLEDSINSVISELKKDPNIEYVQPNYPLTISTAPLDDEFPMQWGLSNNGQEVEGKIGRSGVDINALNAWSLSTGDSSLVVGVLDSGIDITHIDLQNNIYINNGEISDNDLDDDNNGFIDDVFGWDFINDDNSVFDSPESEIHGTYVAGIIAASINNTGISGVAPNIKLLPLKFIQGTTGFTCDAIEAIEYARNKGVEIINCSFGGTDNNQALKDAIEDSGILFVCAAGNRGGNSAEYPVYPACFDLPNILSVASIDNMGVLASFSNYGTDVDIAAPGTNIVSTIPDNGYGYFSGTSVSSAFATGVAALLKSFIPPLETANIKDRIMSKSVPCKALEGRIGSGSRIDAFAALTNTIQPEDTYNGPGAGDDILIDIGEGDGDTWYTMDQLSRIKERLHYGESGVNPASGNFSMTCIDMSVPAPGFQVNMSRTYNSKDDRKTLLGRGWTFGFEGKSTGINLVEIVLPTGSTHRFRKSGDIYIPEDTRANYVRNSDGSGVLTTKDKYNYGFDTIGRLAWMEDKNGNRLTINHQDNTEIINSITDTVGRQYIITYNDNNLIESITAPENRKVLYEYQNNLLQRVIDPNGIEMQYEYDSKNFLIAIIDNNNNEVQTLEYSYNAGDSNIRSKRPLMRMEIHGLMVTI